MPRFMFDPNRVNYSIHKKGKEYNLLVLQRAQSIFSTLLDLLPSNWISGVQGPSYTLELKAVAVELAKIEIALEDVNRDISFETTRSEFLQSIVGYLVFVNGKIPPMEYDDVEFRRFLLTLIRIYFQGSIPEALKDAVDLFLTEESDFIENFLLVRQGASGYDISDQFGFQATVDTGGVFPENAFALQAALGTIMDVIRPAHTLYRIRYLFTDDYIPNGDDINRILDESRWRLACYYYEDFRTYCAGIKDRDRLGRKTNQAVVGEDHSQDF
jgi:hypothetical protein